MKRRNVCEMCMIRWIGSVVQTNNDEMSVKAVCFPSSNTKPCSHYHILTPPSSLITDRQHEGHQLLYGENYES